MTGVLFFGFVAGVMTSALLKVWVRDSKDVLGIFNAFVLFLLTSLGYRLICLPSPASTSVRCGNAAFWEFLPLLLGIGFLLGSALMYLSVLVHSSPEPTHHECEWRVLK